MQQEIIVDEFHSKLHKMDRVRDGKVEKDEPTHFGSLPGRGVDCNARPFRPEFVLQFWILAANDSWPIR